ncbi:hypothetical protein K435DRAFT_804350 [Dendrothele bispora CBS 962.96]|uniref:Uncharacterized protein n=1 Tax=Dendrothele bispora (strain CBS 962.96) TaxID=1314807 RepID=A0A4S8LF19_DENBC|nr:hypothetical protein K435DRAFT_804350 [Dendrothele bispora CBS 962.96]
MFDRFIEVISVIFDKEGNPCDGEPEDGDDDNPMFNKIEGTGPSGSRADSRDDGASTAWRRDRSLAKENSEHRLIRKMARSAGITTRNLVWYDTIVTCKESPKREKKIDSAGRPGPLVDLRRRKERKDRVYPYAIDCKKDFLITRLHDLGCVPRKVLSEKMSLFTTRVDVHRIQNAYLPVLRHQNTILG